MVSWRIPAGAQLLRRVTTGLKLKSRLASPWALVSTVYTILFGRKDKTIKLRLSQKLSTLHANQIGYKQVADSEIVGNRSCRNGLRGSKEGAHRVL